MRAMGDDADVVCYLQNLDVYLKARALWTEAGRVSTAKLHA